jgi:UDP-3-O-[3-hydroxymyristoyl] glucosamine N-acyltransferase LpxD
MDLTPELSWLAGKENYCYWDGNPKTSPSPDAGLVFTELIEFYAMLSWEDDPGTYIIDEFNADIHETAVLGGEGFSFVAGRRMPHLGGVWLGADVEIGPYVTIDRAVLGETIIESQVKIDAHVHVGHNAKIGQGTIITAGAIIGGSARVGENCWIGLGAVIRNKIWVGSDTTIGMGAIVTADVPAGVTYVGNPARKL